MENLTITINHAHAVLLAELLDAARSQAAEDIAKDSAVQSALRARFHLANQMHEELDRVARPEVFGW